MRWEKKDKNNYLDYLCSTALVSLPNAREQITTTAFWISVTIDFDDFIIANTDAIGIYRVNYDSDMWNAIINKLKSSSFRVSICIWILVGACIIESSHDYESRNT